MKKSSILIIAMLIILIGFVAFSALRNTMGNTGRVIKEDVFEGIITNADLEPGIYDGTGVYDRSCNPVENGLTQCDAGIQTEKGLLNFNYKHFMHSQPCIDQGDRLKLEILADGKARVTRL